MSTTAGPTPASPGDALRAQYEAEGAAELLAREKAIATAALEPPELKFRLAAAEAPAAPPAGGAVSAPTLLTPPTPGSVNPLSGLRVPTPELAAAFLASNPTLATGNKDAAPGATGGESSPADARPAPPKPTRRSSANPEHILLVVGGILAVVLGGGLTGVYLYLRTPSKPPAPAIVTEEAPPEEAPVDSATPATTTPVPAEVADASSTTTPPATGVPGETAPVSATPANGQTVASADAPSTGVPPTPAPPPPRVNRPDPTILAWVQKIELTGIRSGTVPKVFMNGKLWEVGEVVNFQLGVKLVGIQGKVLQFEDAEGNTYEYRF